MAVDWEGGTGEDQVGAATVGATGEEVRGEGTGEGSVEETVAVTAEAD